MRLWQFHHGDKVQVVRQPGEGQEVDPRPGARSATVLFDDGCETVCLEDWSPDGIVTVNSRRGLEFIVLSGSVTFGDKSLEPLSWGRLPAGTPLGANVGPQGARIWIKDAPLLHPDVCQLPEQG